MVWWQPSKDVHDKNDRYEWVREYNWDVSASYSSMLLSELVFACLMEIFFMIPQTGTG